MDETDDFDAADLADAILGANDPNWVPVAVVDPIGTRSTVVTSGSPPSTGSQNGKYLGWVLLFLLITAVNVAIALATQVDTDASPIGCLDRYQQCCDGGERSGMCVERCDVRLGYVEGCTDICDGWDDNWGRCEPPCPTAGGLFDAEDDFTRSTEPDC